MKAQAHILVVRLGGGTRPAALVAGTMEAMQPPSDWFARVTAIRIRHVELIDAAAGLGPLCDRVRDLYGQLADMVRADPRFELQVFLDRSQEPATEALLGDILPHLNVYQIVTGAAADDLHHFPPQVGRQAVLSEMRVALARNLATVESSVAPEMAHRLRKALDEANAKPPPAVPDGIVMTEPSPADDMMLAAGLLIWRGLRYPPIPHYDPSLVPSDHRRPQPLCRRISGIV